MTQASTTALLSGLLSLPQRPAVLILEACTSVRGLWVNRSPQGLL